MDIDNDCFEHWARFRQTRFWHVERGGLLFSPTVGSIDGHIDIVSTTGPTKGDRAGRTWLKFNHAQVRRDIDLKFEQGQHFVGYWHTHPERRPVPSSSDRYALTENLAAGGISLHRMIAVIVGNGTIEVSTRVFVVDGHTLQRLPPVS